MKYILKIFLIVLLVVAIIGGACWFFLVQRPDVTMSVFAHWGDYFYDAGRYNRAARSDEFIVTVKIYIAVDEVRLGYGGE